MMRALLISSIMMFVFAAPSPVNVRGQGLDVPEAVLRAESERVAAIDRALQAAVAVMSADGNGGGSGVVITPDGYALSNFHVTSPVGNYMQCGMADGRLYDAVIVGVDPTGDVALIKLLGRDDFPHAEFGDSDEVRAGDWCFAVGNPFLLATDFRPTVTYGIVSGVHRYQYPAGSLLEYADCIQTDAAINPGNSGGPLFNAAGQLIGINGRGSFEKRGRVNVGLGYAISINQIKNFLGYLHSGRIVDHATLGATVVSDGEGNGDVVVSNILESSDAYRRGLRYGDSLIRFGGRPIRTVNGFKNVLGIYPKGWRVPLSYVRNGEQHDIYVRLTGVHAREELLQKVQKRPQLEQPKPEKQPGPDIPRSPIPGVHAKPSVPEEFAKYIKDRPGFANYYFNELETKRVWDAFTNNGNFTDLAGSWLISGETADGDRVTLLLDDEESTAGLQSGRVIVQSNRDLAEQLEPEGSGGFVAAMHLWRRLLQVGPGEFGEVYYQGTQPLEGQDGLFDVLVATSDVVESNVIFDPRTGRLVLLEMYPDVGVDPCEVYFGDYRELNGRQVPYRMIIRFGDRTYADIEVKEFSFNEPTTEDA